MSTSEEIMHEFGAQATYKDGDYESCLQSLKSMKLSSDVNEIAVDANEALVEFAQSAWTARENYKEAIERLKEQAESENSTSCAILYYNEAVLAFHARRWSTVSQILQQSVFSSASPIVRIEVGLLLSESYLKLGEPDRAVLTLANLESAFSAAGKEATESQKQRHFMAKVRSCLMMRNVRRCKKELKTIPPDITQQPCLSSFFKAHQEYLKENYRKSLRLVVSATDLAEHQRVTGNECLAAVFNNALGCNYARLNKYHLAASYFEKAINEYQKNRKSLGIGKGSMKCPMYANHQTAYWSAVHNYALASLQAGVVERAFDCFLQVVKVYPNNVRLWLRLAECCIIACQKNNENEFNLEQRRHECVRDVIGVGPHRKILLNANLSNRKQASSEQGAMPALTYEFAYLCLKNALLALPKISQDQLRTITESPTNSSSSSEREIVLLWPSAPQSPLSAKEIYRLKCSILCAMSYVCLSVCEYGAAIDSARTLLSMEHVSPMHKVLANSYAAESFIFVDRIQEATVHLSLDPVADLTVTEFAASGQGLPPPDWYPKNVKTATLTLLYNVGVICNLMGESAKANEITKMVRSAITNGGECPVLTIVQTLYQLLQKEQFEGVKTVLHRFCPYLQAGEQSPT